MVKNIFALILIFYSCLCYSQDYLCGQDLIATTKSENFCTHCCSNYMDVVSSNTPVKNISFNFIVIQKSNDPDNYQNFTAIN